jgi:hypothetical protein
MAAAMRAAGVKPAGRTKPTNETIQSPLAEDRGERIHPPAGLGHAKRWDATFCSRGETQTLTKAGINYLYIRLIWRSPRKVADLVAISLSSARPFRARRVEGEALVPH